MLSGRGLCDELITRPEESYRLWCVVVCDLETSSIGAPYICIYIYIYIHIYIYTYKNDISSLRVKSCLLSLCLQSFRSILFPDNTKCDLILASVVLCIPTQQICTNVHNQILTTVFFILTVYLRIILVSDQLDAQISSII